ncbi:MAG TPA: phosphoenolpyruvate-utilizing N-terminal domain-containing protein, partial [candidate division Zixibacteria bacterium]|nr:phosphoenolpyruvate-utilizing N-terminal domain-containing protein [candidate division Zixibacteria bacterium]
MTPRRAQSETRWRGIAAAPGVAVGHAYVYRVAHHEPPLRKLGPRDDPEAEFQRLEDALAEVRADLERMQHSSKGFVGSAMDKIFDAQLLIIADETLRTDSRALITDKRLNAESAFWRVVTESQDAIRRSSDPFLREMANEIQTVKRRVLNRLLGLPDMPKV